MTPNVGGVDRMLRMIVGLVLISFFFLFPDSWMRWLSIVGVVLFATALLRWCPPYALLGINTCPMKKS